MKWIMKCREVRRSVKQKRNLNFWRNVNYSVNCLLSLLFIFHFTWKRWQDKFILHDIFVEKEICKNELGKKLLKYQCRSCATFFSRFQFLLHNSAVLKKRKRKRQVNLLLKGIFVKKETISKAIFGPQNFFEGYIFLVEWVTQVVFLLGKTSFSDIFKTLLWLS